MIYLYQFLVLLGAYLIGSISTAIIVSKLFFKTDIRTHGSGNAGATNTLRTLGKGATVAVVLGDIAKGVIAVLIAGYLQRKFASLAPYALYVAGIGAVLGHNFPVYFGFKGGKGILTSLAVIITVDPLLGCTCLVIGVLLIVITKYVSVGSIVGAICYPIFVFIMGAINGFCLEELVFAILIATLAVVRHKENIQRLYAGEERKFSVKK